MPVNSDRSVGWTKRSAAVTVLLAMEEHRKRAGLRLVQLREARAWNQEDLAHESGLSVKTISRFENGRHDGRRSTLKALAAALGVDESDIVGAPPAPLGLGERNGSDDQLDRIEQLLVANSERLEALEAGFTALRAAVVALSADSLQRTREQQERAGTDLPAPRPADAG
jgi:transcriptional regulator with XRE-family HTH domain